MSDLARVLLLNALGATALALAAWGLGRLTRRPALVHALWLIVLVKLFAPPLLGVAVLPAGGTPPVVPAAAVAAALPPVAVPAGLPLEVVAPLEAAPATPRSRPAVAREGSRRAGGAAALLVVWLAGASAVAGLALVRAVRFERGLRASRPAPPGLRARVARLAGTLGLARAPELGLLPARVSPMIWFVPGRLRLLLPERLVEALEPGELDAVVAHELAHLRRRDHWVRYLELAATVVFWWHPVVPWARARLRRAEEQCCDARVVRALAQPPRVYARALLKTLEFLSAAPRPTPALACGVHEAGPLKERLSMIMRGRIPVPTNRTGIAAAALLALVALLAVPTRAEREAARPEPEAAAGIREGAMSALAPGSSGVAADDPAPRDEFRQSMIALERQAAELEEQLLEIRARQSALEQEYSERSRSAELDRLRVAAERAEAAGHGEQAAAAHEAAQRLQREAELMQREHELERMHLNDARELEAPLHRLELEIAELEAAGKDTRAEELRRRAEGLAAELEQRAREQDRARAELETARMLEELQRTHEELERREAVDPRVRAELTAQLEQLSGELQRVRADADPDELRAAEARIDAVARRLDALRATADTAERIRELEGEIERLADELQRLRIENGAADVAR